MPYQLCPGRREYEDDNADEYIYQFEKNHEDDAWADGGEDDDSDDEEPNLIPHFEPISIDNLFVWFDFAEAVLENLGITDDYTRTGCVLDSLTDDVFALIRDVFFSVPFIITNDHFLYLKGAILPRRRREQLHAFLAPVDWQCTRRTKLVGIANIGIGEAT